MEVNANHTNRDLFESHAKQAIICLNSFLPSPERRNCYLTVDGSQHRHLVTVEINEKKWRRNRIQISPSGDCCLISIIETIGVPLSGPQGQSSMGVECELI